MFPLGSTVVDGGVNFSVYSGPAVGVELCVRQPDGSEDCAELVKSADGVWSGLAMGLSAGAWYGYRVYGPYKPATGPRCNPAKRLLDPYGRAIGGNLKWRPSWRGFDQDQSVPDPSDSSPDAPWSVVCGERNAIPRGEATSLGDGVVYETHVKGLTWCHPAVPVELRGTFAGLAQEPILDHLAGLGITAVELLPVHQSLTDGWLADCGRMNYWGYSTIGFFALQLEYSAARRQGGPPGSEMDEFAEMVQALHGRGIEVILDVVYNHTAEGDQDGPTLAFRGLDNQAYYVLAEDAVNPDHGLRYYDNVTGCGNTLDAANPVARRLVLDSMRYWAQYFGIDGFRFDLGSVLAADLPPADPLRDADPQFDRLAPFFDMVANDPVLADVKLITEPWMAGIDYAEQFPTRWSSWNGEFRDDLRDFWREAPAPQPSPSLRTVANRLAGSPDRFAGGAGADGSRGPSASVNFMTCHDGFTLADLVSYNEKHNQANPSDDGTADNRSWNCGSEGPTADPAVLALRRRQSRNMLVTLLASIGAPMLLGGDELSRSQHGNNNCWCQDDELSWVDWANDDGELTALISALVQLRGRHPELRAGAYVQAGARLLPGAGVTCYGTNGEPLTDPELDAPEQHAFSVVFDGPPSAATRLCLALNAYDKPLPFAVPTDPPGTWNMLVDTRAAFGEPLVTARIAAGETFELLDRSAVLLER